jgi:hypothetical protein
VVDILFSGTRVAGGSFLTMDKLIESSPMTLRWLGKIAAKLSERNPPLSQKEGKHYVSVKSPDTGRNCVYLHPQKGQIRLFTRLDKSFAKDLQPTPSTSRWAKTHPSIFTIRSETMVERGIELIISSYQFDKRL